MLEDDNAADYEGLLAAGQENTRYKRMMEQQKAQADILRQRGETPQGQMVSGHYVAPHVLQNLGALANNVGAAYKDKQAMDSGANLDKSMAGQNQLVLKALMRNRGAGQLPAAVPSGLPTTAYDY